MTIQRLADHAQRHWELGQIENAAQTLHARGSDPFRQHVVRSRSATFDTHLLRIQMLLLQPKPRLP